MSSSCDKMCVDCVNTHIYRYRLGHPNHVSSGKIKWPDYYDYIFQAKDNVFSRNVTKTYIIKKYYRQADNS